ncbi:large ribosomal RNA subunit accumulation protein YCED homolog 2, chloroplastic isoform X1 [Cucurbita pepo subsp. pepo]|uniref:large ribosomal RNA subunit accumulation protein YCED homolog 2, chloroplastic isoform X1 n=1 Tax=Cucurbita pepo subsp. pepo TaxID=3664 RepID=UPI000C9D57A3|nr:large ribosomal RNA subunit accumulation protein YCED homolog 2, chloroplastic isoform X1 [Cucurbita pepo subsp. pepo]XP_023527888.1 large ribosomal RNA subunit accumulation protein YCED homolog 2, chloroplastic isoform X1 [Cucurbita pepo subsp. pepo]
MAEAGHLVAAGNVNSISSSFNKAAAPKFATQAFKIKASSKRNDISLRRSSKPPRRLITISTAGSMWQGKWSYDYLLSLQDFNLEDLVEDEHKNAHVFINLCIEKHASFGFTVDGKINTSFTRKCCTCSSPYCREINANFNVLVLSSNRAKRETTLPDIGGDDPSVIYVKPGLEADLDSLVRDTIRLTTSTKDTCSELCEKSQPSVQCKWSSCHSSFHTQSKVGTNREMLIADIGAQNAASIDKRWSRLLELRKSHS